MALKSHKIALRPTDAHRLWFAQQCGYARFAYNNTLSDFKVGLAEVAGIPIVQASQFFASSKTCSKCGDKKADLLLSQRQYTCESCGFTKDRDVNAAINLKQLAAGHSES